MTALTCAFVVGLAAPALAATLRVTPRIQGAGKVTSDHASYSCSSGNQDDRQTKTDCAQTVKVEDWHPFNVGMTLTATASSSPSGRWAFVRWEGCESATGNVCTVSAPGGGSANWTPRAIFDDGDNPTITSGPMESFSTTSERRVAFYFGADESDSSYTCRIDTGAFAGCTSGTAYTLEAGMRTFEVRAYDPSGNASTVASRTIRVIDTTLASAGPTGLTNSRTAAFTFSTAGGSGFECSLNSFTWLPCNGGTKTYTGLADGTYTFRVRGTADGGWYDRLPAARTFTVDGTPPQTTLANLGETPGEGAASTLSTATFGFSSSESGSFECSLDGAAFAACTSPRAVTGLAWGSHSFAVRARDAAGNVDPSPAVREWTVLAPDADADGYRADVDCDDADAAVRPGRAEVPDNDVDENCDGVKAETLDNDGDGVPRPTDCDDGDASVRPGAVDVPGNRIDEDCRGGDAPVPPPVTGGGAGGGGSSSGGGTPTTGGGETGDVVLTVALSHSFKAYKRFTRFSRLRVKGVPNRATVVATCKVRTGRKTRRCAGRARKGFKQDNAFGTVSLKTLARTKLRAGSVITVTVTRPGAIGAVKKIKVRKGKAPRIRTLCLQPGARRPTAC